MVEPGALQGAATQINEKLQHCQRAAVMALGTAAVTESHKFLHLWGGLLRLQAPVLPGNQLILSQTADAAARQQQRHSLGSSVKTYLPSPAFLSLNGANHLEEELWL